MSQNDGFFRKRFLSFDDQTKKLIQEKGLVTKDVGEIIELTSKLQYVNYDRLSGYWYQLLKNDGCFDDDVSFKVIWDSYRFDRRLRLVVMDAIERIEIAIRTQTVNHHTRKYGAFGYLSKNNFQFPNRIFSDNYSINKFTVDFCKKTMKSPVVDKYSKKYHRMKFFPLWKLVELLDFSWTKNLFLAVDNDISSQILNPFDLNKDKMRSWLESLRVVRNICAHHSRLFNRKKLFDIKIPPKKHQPQWYQPVMIYDSSNKGKLFPILSMLGYMLKIIIPKSKWSERLMALIDSPEFEDVPKEVMGFPDN